MRTALHVLGRTLFGGFFLYNGLNHFQNTEQMAGYAASKGTAAPRAAVLGSGAMLVAAGTSLLAGIKPRQGLALAVGFLIPVSLQMHRFWDETDPSRRQTEMINFMKNIALVGAALTMVELPEKWPASVESAMRFEGGDWRGLRLPRSAVRALGA